MNLGEDAGGPGLEIADNEGFSTILGRRDVVVGTGQKERKPAASVLLLGKGRKVLWSAPYRHAPAVTKCLRQRQERVSEEVKEIAWKAQHRLHSRYRKLTARCKNSGKVVTAMGRELLGFIWAIGVHVEAKERKALGQAA